MAATKTQPRLKATPWKETRKTKTFKKLFADYSNILLKIQNVY